MTAILTFHPAPASVGPTVLAGQTKALVSGVPTPLLQVDITKTTHPPNPVPDNSWFGELHFAAEDTDGTDVQIRGGTVNLALAFKAPATWSTAQAVNATNANTAGTVGTTFTWTTAGNIATLNITATANGITPTRMTVAYLLLYASHAAFTYV